MLATREFVFVHVQKSGGEFIKHAMRETMETYPLGDHTPFRDMPSEFKGLPAITFKRNPWDWYVSLWHYGLKHDDYERFENFPEWLRLNFKYRPDSYARVFGDIVGVDGCRKGLVEWGRFETLREDFVAFLDRHEIANGDLRQMVLTHQPVNTSQRKPYRDYYDEELAKLVGTSRMARHYEF